MTDSSAPTPGGAKDPWAHIEVDTLIIWTKQSIVYIDMKKTLQWETTDEYDQRIPSDAKFDLTKRNAVLSDAAVLEASAREELGKSARDELLCLIGNAIACSIDLDYVGAEKALDSARQYSRERSEEVSRAWYLSSSFAAAAIFVVLGLLIWVFRDQSSSVLTQVGMWLVLASVAGAIGALLSVIWRSGSLKFNSSSGRQLHYLEATSRICAGALSGFLVALAVKCEIVLTAFTHGANLHGIMILAALAAGASERFAGSIISKFDTADSKDAAKISK